MSADPHKAFEQRCLMITPDNVEQIAEQYELFARQGIILQSKPFWDPQVPPPQIDKGC